MHMASDYAVARAEPPPTTMSTTGAFEFAHTDSLLASPRLPWLPASHPPHIPYKQIDPLFFYYPNHSHANLNKYINTFIHSPPYIKPSKTTTPLLSDIPDRHHRNFAKNGAIYNPHYLTKKISPIELNYDDMISINSSDSAGFFEKASCKPPEHLSKCKSTCLGSYKFCKLFPGLKKASSLNSAASYHMSDQIRETKEDGRPKVRRTNSSGGGGGLHHRPPSPAHALNSSGGSRPSIPTGPHISTKYKPLLRSHTSNSLGRRNRPPSPHPLNSLGGGNSSGGCNRPPSSRPLNSPGRGRPPIPPRPHFSSKHKPLHSFYKQRREDLHELSLRTFLPYRTSLLGC